MFPLVHKMNEVQNAEVWKRLIQGKPVDGIGLGMKDGRIDLSGLRANDPTITTTFQMPFAEVSELNGITVLRDIKWESLDFSASHLNGLRFHNCNISDCVFDESKCQDWRLWGTTVQNTSFSSTDLRKSALGAVKEERINTFQNVDFTLADLRHTAYVSCKFVDCLFKNTKLTKVNFQGSAFSDCRFEGELREVIFSRKGFGADALLPNKMLRIDFVHAQLRSVEFRGLDLDDVRFPADPDHILLNEYSQALDRLLQGFQNRTDIGSRQLAAALGIARKWAGPGRSRGVLNIKDWLEIGGEDAQRFVLETIESWNLEK
jgi:uncharacterized protein YjbI with pentapeptide repeats